MQTTKETIGQITLVGLALPHKTTNEGGRAMADIGGLWQRWMQEQIPTTIQNKISDDIYAVYHDYDGDHTKPYAYFIGCPVSASAPVPEGLTTLSLPSGTYTKLVAKGKLPDAIAATWQEIWQSDIKRRYETDFEVYGSKSKDRSNGAVDIYLS